MKKTFIKVIKRKDAEEIKNAKVKNDCELKTPTIGAEKTTRHLQHKMIDTVSNWVSEYRLRNHVEKTAAIQRFFGNESTLSKI